MTHRTKLITLFTLLLFLIVAPLAAQDDEPVTVTLLYNTFLQNSFGDGPPPLEVIEAAVAEAHPNYEIELLIAPDSIEAWRDQLSVSLTAQDGSIDIYGMDTIWVQEFGRARWAAPLNDDIPALREAFVASGIDTFTYQEDILAVPFWGSIGGFFYNEDILAEYGYDAPPATYAELVSIAEDITAQDESLTGFVWSAAREEGLTQVWSEFFLAHGGQYFDEDGNCAIDSPEGIAAVQYMVDLIESGLSPRQVTTWDGAAARVRFLDGEALFLRHNADIATFLDDPERSGIVGSWGLASNPGTEAGPASNATGGFAFALNPFSDEREAALNVLRIIADFEVQAGFARAWGPVQYYEGLYEDPFVAQSIPNADAISALLPDAADRPRSERYSQLSQIIQNSVHAILVGTDEVQEGLSRACDQIDRLR